MLYSACIRTALCLLFVATSALAALRPQFEVVPLSIGSSNRDFPVILRINNSNQIAVTMAVHEPAPHGECFLWQTGSVQIIGEGRIEDINDSGAYIGDAPGSIFNTPIVHAINNLGQVVGEAPTAFLWDSNGLTFYPVGGVAGQSRAVAVNNYGVATGGAFSGNTYHAFIFTISNVTDIGMIPKTSISEGAAINDRGHVVLTATYTNRTVKRIYSYFYHDGRTTRLPALPGNPHTWAKAMNNSDEIVGFVGPTARPLGTNFGFGVTVANGFLYSSGRLYNINRLLTRSSRIWHISNAVDINDSGSIVALARRPEELEQPVLLRRVRP